MSCLQRIDHRSGACFHRGRWSSLGGLGTHRGLAGVPRFRIDFCDPRDVRRRRCGSFIAARTLSRFLSRRISALGTESG